MKKITVVWVKPENDKTYDKEMRVVYSDHERFTKGTRFDFGFLSIALVVWCCALLFSVIFSK